MLAIEGDRFLVTGGAGFIGSHICEELLNQNKEVICLDNMVGGKVENVKHLRDPRFTFVKADICNLEDIRHYFHNVDVVFNEAASKCTVCRNDPYLDLQVNAMGAWNVFEASYWGKVRKVVHASTGSVYGEMKETQDESHPYKPVSFYGVSKLAGERYLEAFWNYYKQDYAVVRYFHVYGPRQESADHGGVIPIFIRRALKNEPIFIYGDGKQVRSFTSVKDVVNANFALANKKEIDCEAYNVASGIQVSIFEIAQKIVGLTHSKSRIMFYPERLGDIKNFDVRSHKIQDLGVSFSDFDEGLRDTIDWYRSYFRA